MKWAESHKKHGRSLGLIKNKPVQGKSKFLGYNYTTLQKGKHMKTAECRQG